jgi:hypothetical protein
MTFFLSLLFTAFLGTMLLAVLLPFKPDVLRLVTPLVCPPGTRMEIQTFQANPYRPGERGLAVYAVGPAGSVDIKNRTLIAFWGVCCLVTLPLALYLADWIVRLF